MVTHWGSFATLSNFTCFLTLEVKMKAEMTLHHTEMICVTILVLYLDVDTHFTTSYLLAGSNKIDSINKHV